MRQALCCKKTTQTLKNVKNSPKSNNLICKSDTDNTPVKLSENQTIEPELQKIATAWPCLPQHIKAAKKVE